MCTVSFTILLQCALEFVICREHQCISKDMLQLSCLFHLSMNLRCSRNWFLDTVLVKLLVINICEANIETLTGATICVHKFLDLCLYKL